MVEIKHNANAVLTCSEMASCDRWTVEQGLATGIELMENAGAVIADLVMQAFADATPIHILCGPGNNGGDGYVVARLLRERGLDAKLYALRETAEGTDAALAAGRWQGEVHPFEAFEPDGKNGLLIDAVFGAGFKGSLPEKVITVLERAQQSGMRKIAVDVPSGLNGDTGLAETNTSYDATVTFFRKKPGHLCGDGPELCGTVHVADIGVRADFDGTLVPTVFENGPSIWHGFEPSKMRHTHKYRQGHVAVFSGPRYKTGAARLSALASARAGAGAVTIIGRPDALDIHANHVSSIMLKPCKTGEAGNALTALNQPRAVVLGPGFDDLEEARVITEICLSQRNGHNLPLVLDADGITAFAGESETLFALSRKSVNSQLVITPHEGEFARLFPDIAKESTLGKVQKARAAAERAQAVIVYKGADTIIASPSTDVIQGSIAAINSNATPALATAGSGDVLSGIIAGLMAQGMPAYYAACRGVWLHGEAGKCAGLNCIAEDLIDALRDIA